MSPEALTIELRAVLDTERNAIRRRDASAVLAAAESKEALLSMVMNSGDAEKPLLVQALAQVREELKRNLLLLAHARDLTRDTIASKRPQAASSGERLSLKL